MAYFVKGFSGGALKRCLQFSLDFETNRNNRSLSNSVSIRIRWRKTDIIFNEQRGKMIIGGKIGGSSERQKNFFFAE